MKASPCSLVILPCPLVPLMMDVYCFKGIGLHQTRIITKKWQSLCLHGLLSICILKRFTNTKMAAIKTHSRGAGQSSVCNSL